MHLSVFLYLLLQPYLLVLLSIIQFEHLYASCLQLDLESLALNVPLPVFWQLLFSSLPALFGSQLDQVEHSIENQANVLLVL